jgi:hypothetical protein
MRVCVATPPDTRPVGGFASGNVTGKRGGHNGFLDRHCVSVALHPRCASEAAQIRLGIATGLAHNGAAAKGGEVSDAVPSEGSLCRRAR